MTLQQFRKLFATVETLKPELMNYINLDRNVKSIRIINCALRCYMVECKKQKSDESADYSITFFSPKKINFIVSVNFESTSNILFFLELLFV